MCRVFLYRGTGSAFLQVLLFPPQVEPFFTVQPVYSLVVDFPALSQQQHMDTSVSIAYAHPGHLPNPFSQYGLSVLHRFVSLGITVYLQHRAHAPLADGVLLQKVFRCLFAVDRPYQFFESTSCNMALSKLRSATSFFSLAFSSSNCLSFFMSLGSMPPYFFFQR